MEKQINKVLDLKDKVLNLNEEMNNCLIELVKKNGGIVEFKEHNYSLGIYAYIYNYETKQFIEKRVSAVKVDDFENLQIQTNDNDWHCVFDGDIIVNSTLYNLCEGIVEYI